MGQLPILFFFLFFEEQTHTHTREREMGFNTGTPQLHSKAMITFKGGWDKLYYTQHYLKQCGNTNIHTHTHKGEGRGF